MLRRRYSSRRALNSCFGGQPRAAQKLSLWTTQQILQHPVMGEQSCCEGQGAEQTGGLLG